jgi:hypothetical protein
MNKRVDKILDGLREPTWKIPVKAMCACGEEISDKEYVQLLHEMVEAGIIREIAPDTFEIVRHNYEQA